MSVIAVNINEMSLSGYTVSTKSRYGQNELGSVSSSHRTLLH